MKEKKEFTDPHIKDFGKDNDGTLDETGAEHTGSNNTDENSEGRKEGKSYYEKLREVDPGKPDSEEKSTKITFKLPTD
ncbi:MAG: hypothetical protein ACXVNM_08435 [Bacteroidia bacterium]